MNVEMSRQDYSLACHAVQNFLDQIKITGHCGEPSCEPILENVPSADEIVDAVWDAIK